LGIELRDGFGEKIQSSSWLIKGKGPWRYSATRSVDIFLRIWS
jgi:hypothetical protein